MRLISWNVHGLPLLRGRRDRFARWAAEVSRRAPALLLLQELWLESEARALAGWLPAARYRFLAAPARARLRPGGLLVAVSVSAGWRIVRHAFEPFEARAPAWRVWEADGLMQKGLLAVTLSCAGRPLTVVNTHLQAEYGERRYGSIRRLQAQQLVRSVAAAAAAGPVLVAGDFNTTPDDSAVYGVFVDAGWQDLTRALRDARGGGTCFPARGGSHEWLDYAFAVMPQGAAAAADVSLICNTGRDAPYSDHDALVVDVSVPQMPC